MRLLSFILIVIVRSLFVYLCTAFALFKIALWPSVNACTFQCKNKECFGDSGVDFTKGFKTWNKFSTEIRFMLIPIIVLFIAHVFITGNF